MDNLNCIECGLSSGCSCDAKPRGSKKYIPRDHKKELEIHLRNITEETNPE